MRMFPFTEYERIKKKTISYFGAIRKNIDLLIELKSLKSCFNLCIELIASEMLYRWVFRSKYGVINFNEYSTATAGGYFDLMLKRIQNLYLKDQQFRLFWFY